jgi:hypothetical protein
VSLDAAIIVSVMTVGCVAMLALGGVRIRRARNVSGSPIAGSDADIKEWYASYMEAVSSEVSACLATAAPDDEWLTVIKGKVEASARPPGAPAAKPKETGVTPVPWEIVESAR